MIIYVHYGQLPEKEFQMFNKSSEVPVRNLHLPQDLRKLHCKKSW